MPLANYKKKQMNPEVYSTVVSLHSSGRCPSPLKYHVSTTAAGDPNSICSSHIWPEKDNPQRLTELGRAGITSSLSSFFPHKHQAGQREPLAFLGPEFTEPKWTADP